MSTNSTGLRNAIASAIDGYDAGVLEIRSGAAPGPNAADAGTLLVSVALPADAFSGPATGVLSKSGTWEDTSADATGTAAHFRIKASGDAGTADSSQKRIEGTVTLEGGGGDLILDSLDITAGQTVTIVSFTITVPA